MVILYRKVIKINKKIVDIQDVLNETIDKLIRDEKIII